MRKFCARITMITEIYIQYSGHYGSINAFNPRDPGINPIQKQVKAGFIIGLSVIICRKPISEPDSQFWNVLIQIHDKIISNTTTSSRGNWLIS